MLVKIKRQENSDSRPYWEEYEIDLKERVTVSYILESINYYLDNNFVDPASSKDIDCDNFEFVKVIGCKSENLSRPIKWEHSCMQKMCGACAMVINIVPGLACSTYVDPSKNNTLVLQPLSKFKVLEDLVVDRSIIYQHSKDAELHVNKAKSDNRHKDMQYIASKCLKCGLCLEVCPKYIKDGPFYGAAFAVEDYLCYSRSAEKSEVSKDKYKNNFAKHCSKAGSCQKICPQNIPVLASIGRMNKLT